MAEQEFEEKLRDEGIYADTTAELKNQGCNNLRIFFTLRPGDIDILNLPEDQKAILKHMINSFQGIRDESGNFNFFLQKEGISDETVRVLRLNGCDNLELLKGLPFIAIDELPIPVEERNRLIRAIQKLRQTVQQVFVENDPSARNKIVLPQVHMKADNLAEGAKFEGMRLDATGRGNEVRFGTLTMSAQNVGKGASVVGFSMNINSDSKMPMENVGDSGPSGLKVISKTSHAIIHTKTVPADIAIIKSHMDTDQTATPQKSQHLSANTDIKIKPTPQDFFRMYVKDSQVYPMYHDERGRCVIFNLLKNEKDAKADCDRLSHLFSNLHLSIKLYSGEAMMEKIKSYTGLVRRKKYQCVMVIFLGQCSVDDISGPDVKTPYKIIYEEFKNFENIPKLFLFISYRNSCTVNIQDHLLPHDTLTCFGFQNAGDNKTAIAGNQGSQFAEILTRVIVEFAHCKHFSDLLKEVKETLEQEKTGVISFKDNLGKKLYFFPGRSIEDK